MSLNEAITAREEALAGTTARGYFALTMNERAIIANLITDYIDDAYRAYRRYGGREPELTIAALANYVGQHGLCPDRISGVPRQIYRAVANEISKAKRRGVIVSSLTTVNGREVRAYEPGMRV